MRPYWFTAVGLAGAAAADLWTGNRLWFHYTVLGLGGWALLAAAVRHRRLDVPTRLAWLLGTTAALHYGGGSLAGLHSVGGPNGLYFALPWWDNAVHLLGSATVALIAQHALHPTIPAAVPRAVLAACVAATVGVLVELYEFAQFLWLGTVDQGFYTNTLVDLYNNLLGAVLGVVLGGRIAHEERQTVDALGG